MLDCGAGIGRVSQHLLIPLFGRVSLLEENNGFCETARHNLHAVHQIFPMRMGQYRANLTDRLFDLIWVQWVIIYNSDGTRGWHCRFF